MPGAGKTPELEVRRRVCAEAEEGESSGEGPEKVFRGVR